MAFCISFLTICLLQVLWLNGGEEFPGIDLGRCSSVMQIKSTESITETRRMSRISNIISYHIKSYHIISNHIVLHITFLSIHDIAAAMRRHHSANLWWFLNQGRWRWGEASLSWKNMVALFCKVIFLAFSPYHIWQQGVIGIMERSRGNGVHSPKLFQDKKPTTQTKTPWQWSCSQPFLPHQVWQELDLLIQLANAVVPNW